MCSEAEMNDPYTRCDCSCGDICPLGKTGSEGRCTVRELRAALDNYRAREDLYGETALSLDTMTAERDRLRVTVEKAADTFNKLATAMSLMRKSLAAASCQVAEDGCRKALQTYHSKTAS
jgi:hypothetical protein